jgi:uncharacterized protein (TIGR00255 family)
MTGYGKTVVAYKGKKINVEIKSLNSKQLDLTTRIAPLYREKEMEIRQLIAEQLQRGKVEFALWIEKDAAAEAAPVNTALMQNYLSQLQAFADEHQMQNTDWMQILVRMPDVLTKTEVEVLDDDEWQAARQGVCEAVKALVEFRTQEGAALEKKFAEKIDNIEQLLWQHLFLSKWQTPPYHVATAQQSADESPFPFHDKEGQYGWSGQAASN